jgi:hypothetical protein
MPHHSLTLHLAVAEFDRVPHFGKIALGNNQRERWFAFCLNIRCDK